MDVLFCVWVRGGLKVYLIDTDVVGRYAVGKHLSVQQHTLLVCQHTQYPSPHHPTPYPHLSDTPQGDGTAAILAHDPRIYTLSVHAASNFPARKQQSTHDVALADGVGDDEYLGTVGEIVPSIVRNFQPDIVLYDAGVDTHQDDALGRLAMTDAGLMRREMLVLDTCLAHGIPVAGYVGGGYHVDLDVLARRHCILHHAAAQLWRDYQL